MCKFLHLMRGAIVLIKIITNYCISKELCTPDPRILQNLRNSADEMNNNPTRKHRNCDCGSTGGEVVKLLIDLFLYIFVSAVGKCGSNVKCFEYLLWPENDCITSVFYQVC
ncbi:hypothetical protein ATANTOWER_008394 [Ataeniobius toweri]|uniref:Uncharacterized protein n=1 Tax=Ataeniobius toweri TaxID=208326 RepID=A0ABU7CHQ7_9TELE|nr:hypothetical protein [Ataeniobius toweri]